MPELAKKDNKSAVSIPSHGSEQGCCAFKDIKNSDGQTIGQVCIQPKYAGALTSSSFQGSDNVFVETIGVVRKDDTMSGHQTPCDGAHSPKLTSFSGTVFANNKNIGRIGDLYTAGHTITTGATTVFAG